MDEVRQINALIRDLTRKMDLIVGIAWGGLTVVLLINLIPALFPSPEVANVVAVIKGIIFTLQVICILWQISIVVKIRRLRRQAKVLDELKSRAYWDRIYASQEPIGQHGRIELIENEDGTFSLP